MLSCFARMKAIYVLRFVAPLETYSQRAHKGDRPLNAAIP